MPIGDFQNDAIAKTLYRQRDTSHVSYVIGVNIYNFIRLKGSIHIDTNVQQ